MLPGVCHNFLPITVDRFGAWQAVWMIHCGLCMLCGVVHSCAPLRQNARARGAFDCSTNAAHSSGCTALYVMFCFLLFADAADLLPCFRVLPLSGAPWRLSLHRGGELLGALHRSHGLWALLHVCCVSTTMLHLVPGGGWGVRLHCVAVLCCAQGPRLLGLLLHGHRCKHGSFVGQLSGSSVPWYADVCVL